MTLRLPQRLRPIAEAAAARYNEVMSPEVSDLLKRALALPVDERP